jgi:hypothetical protein
MEKISRDVLTLGIKQEQALGSFWISNYSPIHPSMIHAWLSSTRNGLFIDCFFSLFAMTTRSTASSTRIEQAVAETQGLIWLLDDVLQAQDDLLALLAKPSGLPMEQRERLLIFCD